MSGTADKLADPEAIIVSEAMRNLMGLVERVALSSAAVLITGETGVGKELIARAIHQRSLRCSKPWVDLNCAALPEHLVESELFGYEKGAFSGADGAKPGLFEVANEGTLFLDEIGEVDPKVQVKLLRVLEGIPYYRLGGNRKIAVDVRIIAATNSRLEEAVRAGRFRNDLYHRLGQFQLHVPALRERPDDVVALAEHFLGQHNPTARFAPDALKALQSYDWPGNVRELRNVVLQTATLTDALEIHTHELMLDTTNTSALPVEKAPTDLSEMEREAIMKVLARTGGHQGQAAEQLGISRRTLSRKLKLYKVQPERRMDAPRCGVLSGEQQDYFRVTATAPVLIKNVQGQALTATLVNISSRGLALQGVENPFNCTGTIEVQFTLPGTDSLIEAKGRMVWADLHRKVGIQLTDVPPDAQRELDRWLIEKQRQEGWHWSAQPR